MTDSPVVVALVGVHGTRGVTLVLKHDQVVVTASAVIRPILTAGAVRFARNTRALVRICLRHIHKTFISTHYQLLVNSTDCKGKTNTNFHSIPRDTVADTQPSR